MVEGNKRDRLVKVSVVTGVDNVEAVVWRRGRGCGPGPSVMSEQDVDDVAFLTGTNSSAQITHTIYKSLSFIPNPPCDSGGVAGTESPPGPTKKSLYENDGVVACSQKRALCIATVVFVILFIVAIIIAYTGPQSGKLIKSLLEMIPSSVSKVEN